MVRSTRSSSPVSGLATRWSTWSARRLRTVRAGGPGGRRDATREVVVTRDRAGVAAQYAPRSVPTDDVPPAARSASARME